MISESKNIAIAAIFDEDLCPNANLNAGRGDRYWNRVPRVWIYPSIGVATVQFTTATTLVAEVAWKRANSEVACQFAARGLPNQAISRGTVARGVRRSSHITGVSFAQRRVTPMLGHLGSTAEQRLSKSRDYFVPIVL